MNFRRLAPVWIAAGVLCCSPVVRAQSRKPEQLRAGKLLVAQREAMDPNFAESVVLLINYGGDGALGLVINQQTKVPIARALPGLQGARNYRGPAFVGGPVSRGAVTALLHAKPESEKPEPPTASNAEPRSDAEQHLEDEPAEKPVFGKVYFVTHKTELETALKLGLGPDALRIYAGYAGWGPGQLENEVKRGDWYIFDATEQTVFDNDPETLWKRLIEQTEMRIAQLQLLPGDDDFQSPDQSDGPWFDVTKDGPSLWSGL